MDARHIRSPKRKIPESKHLFHFDDISKYVIPNSALYGRLVICTTRKHKIIGFPVELYGRYQRNYFRFNLCLVFERSADLSCFEPIIRKIGRVLTACEVCHSSRLGFYHVDLAFSSLGGVRVFVLSGKLPQNICRFRATIRGPEFIPRDVHTYRQVQLYRA